METGAVFAFLGNTTRLPGFSPLSGVSHLGPSGTGLVDVMSTVLDVHTVLLFMMWPSLRCHPLSLALRGLGNPDLLAIMIGNDSGSNLGRFRININTTEMRMGCGQVGRVLATQRSVELSRGSKCTRDYPREASLLYFLSNFPSFHFSIFSCICAASHLKIATPSA
jgi:hypothetical protein